ncbi:MAG TPA: winged helix-turn-helix transcriptional regulator [Stellaceae bacterium]|nr:winged helix-turn-helix transcriptional regulator [Stellaceae bacterium]
MERREEAGTEDKAVMLGLLAAVERDSALTQRHLARELGIALGLANAYLRRCAKKGLIKMRQVPLNRYAYYLTPRGFAEKSRLTAEYLSTSFDFFRQARRDCAALLVASAERGWRRVALVGAGELAEIAVLGAAESGVEIVAVIDADGERSCAGRSVVADLTALDPGTVLDAVIITDMRAPQACYEATLLAAAARGLGAERVLAPQLLHITPGKRLLARGAAR